MIPGISEHTRVGDQRFNGLYLNQSGTLKATLHQATVTFEEMGERTIKTQVRIDGSIVPSFDGWELDFRGETFVLPTLKPQATKDNSTRNALVDLEFTSAPVNELKRYFFAEMTEIEVGTIIIDKYVASLRLSLTDFVTAFNRVLNYYFPDGRFVMQLASGADDGELKDFEIDYLYIWDVLQKLYDVYNVSWRFSTQNDVTTIMVGYTPEAIGDDVHIFQYGFNGGLLSFERHVEDTDIYNVLLGRGSEKNLPYRYFKKTDPFNPIWNPDPDAIPELSSVYFSRLLDANFRWYVRGWVKNSHRDTSNDEGYTLPDYDEEDVPEDFLWAYQKGRYTDTKFDPVEYVKDDASIAIYGVRQGKLDDDDNIFPTIQGVDFPNDSPDIGRVDEVVDVYVTDEESEEAVFDQVTVLPDIYQEASGGSSMRLTIQSSQTFTIEAGRVGRIEYAWLEDDADNGDPPTGIIDPTNSRPYAKIGNDTYGFSLIPAGGPYYYCADIDVYVMPGESYLKGKYGITDVRLHCTPKDGASFRQIFTIWVKNIWQTTQILGETDVEYAHRVWDPILGDKLGKSAAVCFSDGFLSTSEDYEFLIQKLPEVDRTKSLNGVSSEWKITLVRSDAEYEATGLYIPNTKTGGLPIAGNHFFFTGIDIPIQYVEWAEEKLSHAKMDALTDKAWTNPTWVINLDKVKAHMDGGSNYAGTLAEKLDAGVVVTITDPRFTPNSAIQLGIRSVTFSWNEPSSGSPYIVPDIEVVLSDKIVRTVSYDGIKNEVYYISRNYATTSSVKKMARSQNMQAPVANGSIISYLGPVIGTVEI